MIYQLRPLGLGEILDRTAELYRNHFLLFAGIAAIFSGFMLVIQILHLSVLTLLGYPHIAPHLLWASGIAAILDGLAVLLVACVAIAANNRAVAWVYLGHPATIHGAAKSVLPRLRRYLWLMTLSGLRAWGPLALLYVLLLAAIFTVLPHGLLGGAAHHAAGQNPSAMLTAGLGFLLVAPLLLAALIYGIWMSLRLALGTPICVVEELTARKSLRRSIELSKGSLGRIFVLGLLVYVIQLLLGLLLGMPFILYVFKHPGHPMPLGLLALQQIASFITNTLIGPIYATGLTLFYYDQRVRKEGFDIEWMMQAAGLTAEAASPAPEQA